MSKGIILVKNSKIFSSKPMERDCYKLLIIYNRLIDRVLYTSLR